MTQKDHEQELQDYLEGESDLSRAYRAAPRAEPPARVDDAILAASRKAVKSRPRFAFSPFASDWHERAALAAVVVLSVVLIVTMQRQTRLTEPPVTRPPLPAVMSDEAPVPVLKQKPAMERRTDSLKGQLPERKREAATLMKEAAEPTGRATAPAVEEEIGSIEERAARGLEKQQSFDAAAGSGKNATEKDRPLLNEEPAFMPAPAESMLDRADKKTQRQAMPAAGGLISPSLSEATAWLNEIKALWQAGQKEQARLELQAFLQSYPSFGEDVLREKLDPDLVNAVLPGSE